MMNGSTIIGVGLMLWVGGFLVGWSVKPCPRPAVPRIMADTTSEKGYAVEACGPDTLGECFKVHRPVKITLTAIAFGVDSKGDRHAIKVNDDGSVNCRTVRRGP